VLLLCGARPARHARYWLSGRFVEGALVPR
jgi:hypothetical protein